MIKYSCLLLLPIALLMSCLTPKIKIPETDRVKANLKGQVRFVATKTFAAVNKNGQLVPGEPKDPWGDADSLIYNEQGMLSEIYYFDLNGQMKGKGKFEFDSIGRKKSYYRWREKDDFNGAGDLMKSFLYNTKGQLEKENWQYDNFTYTYDKMGNEAIRVDRDPFGQLLLIDSTFSDAKGMDTFSVHYNYAVNGGHDTIVDRYRRTYDTAGHMIREESFRGNTAGLLTYTYDSHGNILEWSQRDYENGMVYFQRLFKYEYDSHSNWIKKTEFQQDKPGWITIRQIGYY